MNWGWLLIVGMIVAVSAVYIFGRRTSDRLLPEALVVVTWSDDEIIATYPRDKTVSVRWDTLTRVAIRTTSEGPFSPDVFWGFHAGNDQASLVYPGGATGENEILEELQRRLPGFNNDALISAMSCASDNYFVLWERSA